MRQALRAAAAALAALLAGGPAVAEFRFSSQRSLSLPDPFLRAKPKRSRPAPPSPAAPGSMPQRAEGLDLKLLALILALETHFRVKPVIVSGCRSHARNAAAGGARHSFHLSCMAADIIIPGVGPETVRDYALAMPGRGGVGTYCGLSIVHIDSGPARHWHRECGEMARLWDDPFALN